MAEGYDLIVLGTGSAATGIASRCRAADRRIMGRGSLNSGSRGLLPG